MGDQSQNGADSSRTDTVPSTTTRKEDNNSPQAPQQLTSDKENMSQNTSASNVDAVINGPGSASSFLAGLLQQQASTFSQSGLAPTQPAVGPQSQLYAGVGGYNPSATQNTPQPLFFKQNGRMVMLTPDHPMFADMQARLAAFNGPDVPLILNRTAGGSMELHEEIGKMAQESVEETVSNEVFAVYENKEVVPGCQPHPGDIVESGSLAALNPPNPDYPLTESLSDEIIRGGKLSSLQLEGVIYACQRHQMVLPSDSRAGFFIGDAAGVGKGRQISGVILDNYARGRTKHVWFSISTDLIVDARRDLSDIGCHVKVIEGAQQLDKETKVFGLPADFKEGVVFSTYATLVSSTQKGGAFNTSRHSRLQQLVDWCGGSNFQGCLIFDECHKAKNFVPGKEHASTKVALAVTNLQRMLPMARVMYCSATGVSDVKNMAFMERLGLWGDGAAFNSFEQFLETVQRKGLGVAEMLAMEMKTAGMYIARSLSFKQAEFLTEQVSLTKEQVKMYNMAAHVWNELRKSLESAIDRTGCTNSRMWSSYWGSHQRFFKQLCMGIKVPAVVAEAKKALDMGHCVVIGLQTTGEASLESELSKSGTQLSGFVSLCREIMSRFIQRHFPTVIEGNPAGQGPAEDDWCVTAKQMLLSFAQQIELPISTLDDIIQQLGGPGGVAEMTGRRGRVVQTSPTDNPRFELRDSDSGNIESLNVRERNLFMEGKKLVAIISDAASTGISLHADVRAANQRRRVHLTIELPWSADKAVQQLGRSHRSNQSSGPLYKLMTTNLGGERRFAAAVAKRLQHLGALTKGDRRAATGADLDEFNYDTQYGRNALRTMYNSICQKQLALGVSLESVTLGKFDFAKFNQEMTDSLTMMGILDKDTLTSAAKVKDNASGDVGKFLNRIFGLSVGRQNLMFNYFTQCVTSQISMAKREGRYNEGLVDITASAVEMAGKPKEVFKTRNTTNNPTKHIVLEIDRGMSWERAVRRLENHPGPDNGFYASRREVRGKRFYILATLKEGSTHLFKIARPNTGVSSFDEEKTDLLQKYSPISQEKAHRGWNEQYEDASRRCIHGPQCRAGNSCTVGSRCYKMHLLCGGIVTMMSLLESTIARYGPRLNLTKSESTLRVVRVKLDSGERVVGIRYHEMLIPLVEKSIKEEDYYKSVIAKQQTQTTLTNGLQLSVSFQADHSSHLPRSVTIDPVSAVIPRLLTKAMTPPVTIRNFFKPVTKATKTETKAADNSEVKPSTNTRVTDSDCRLNQRDQSKSDDKMEQTPNSIDLKDSRTKSDDKLDLNDFQAAPKSSSVNNTKGQKRTSSQMASSNQTKRPRVSSQASILTFTKQKSGDKKSNIKKQKSCETGKSNTKCPVCGHVFTSGTSNDQVNMHVDNCLIE